MVESLDGIIFSKNTLHLQVKFRPGSKTYPKYHLSKMNLLISKEDLNGLHHGPPLLQMSRMEKFLLQHIFPTQYLSFTQNIGYLKILMHQTITIPHALRKILSSRVKDVLYTIGSLKSKCILQIKYSNTILIHTLSWNKETYVSKH